MHADWIQSIERQLAEVPPGCLLESPVSQVPRLHRPGPHWAGRGRVETFSLFPGLTLSHLCFQSETFFSPACRPGLRPGNHPLPPGAGWAGR